MKYLGLYLTFFFLTLFRAFSQDKDSLRVYLYSGDDNHRDLLTITSIEIAGIFRNYHFISKCQHKYVFNIDSINQLSNDGFCNLILRTDRRIYIFNVKTKDLLWEISFFVNENRSYRRKEIGRYVTYYGEHVLSKIKKAKSTLQLTPIP